MSRVSAHFRLAKIRFHAEDLDLLQRYFPNAGYNRVVRELVHTFIRKLDTETSRRLSADEALRGAKEVELPPDFDTSATDNPLENA